MKFLNKPLFFAFFVALCIPHSLLALIGIDVAHYKQGIRIVQYDTKEMKFESITYYAMPTTSSTRAPMAQNIPFPLLNITYKGEVTVPNDFDLTKYFVRSQGAITYEGNAGEVSENFSEKILLATDYRIEQGKEVLKLLQSKSCDYDKKLGTFKVKFFVGVDPKESKDFSNIFANQSDNNNERGVLGEIATDLIMMRCGYWKWPAQNGKTGFDGVYLDLSDSPELFLTESKCRNESVHAEGYFGDALSHTALRRKIKQLKKPFLNTHAKVAPFLEGTGKVFLFVQRILPCGRSEFHAEPLNLKKYRAESVTKTSPQTVKDEAIIELSENFESHLAFLESAMRALDISNEDLKELLKARQQACAKLTFNNEGADLTSDDEDDDSDVAGPSGLDASNK